MKPKLIYLIIFSICLIFLSLYYYFYYLPSSSQQQTHREFNVLPQEDFNILLEYIDEKKEEEVLDFPVFENYKCSLHITNKDIPETISENTLVFFLDNDIHWDDECYYYCSDTNEYYYPEPNSYIFSNKPLKLHRKNINKYPKIIIGKQQNDTKEDTI